MYVDDFQLAGKKQNIDPMWKIHMKDADLGEPTSFFDHVYLGCTQRECQTSKDIVDNYRNIFESRISAGATEKLPCSGSCKEMCGQMLRTGEENNSTVTQSRNSMIDDHQFKEEEIGSVGELSKVFSQIVLKCLCLARIGRPDFLRSVNKLARAVTKWTKACDKRLARLISYIHHTSEYKQYCYVGNTAKQCRLGLFQDSHFAGDLEDSKSTSCGNLCILGSHTFVPVSWDV